MVGTDQMDQLWLTGVYPPSFPAKSDRAAAAWRKAYITTFLERDNPSFGFSIQLSHRRGAGGDDGDGDPASGLRAAVSCHIFLDMRFPVL